MEWNLHPWWIQRRFRFPSLTGWSIRLCPSELLTYGGHRMVHQHPWPACHTSAQGRILFVNAALSRSTGKPSDSLQGLSFEDLFVTPPVFEQTFHPVMVHIKTAHNDHVPMLLTHLVPHTCGSSTLFFFPAILTDLQQRLGDVHDLDLIPAPVALLDENGGLQEVNQACRQHLGAHPPAHLAQWVHEDDRYALAQLLRRLRKTDQTTGTLSLRLRQSNTLTQTTVVLAHVPSHRKDMSGCFLAMFAQDSCLTSPKDPIESTPDKMQLMGQLASGIVHDFNNLLTGILGFCDLLLQRHQPTEPTYQDIHQIKQSAMRAARLIQKLLDFSKEHPPVKSRFCLKQCINELRPLMNRMVGPKILVMVDEEGSGPYWIHADIGHLEQIVLNLVINGRDAMSNGGGGVLTVKLHTRTLNQALPVVKGSLDPRPYVVLDIQDTGVGIDPADIERIFDPFFSTKDPGHGTGLGLANVLQMVEYSQGGITVESIQNKGTTLSLFFPACPASDIPLSVKATAPALHVPDNHGKAIRILLVEDEDPVRLFAARALRDQGHDVIEARDGMQALKLLNDHTMLHVMVTDVMMPGIDGPTLAAKVKEIVPQIKILFVSGYPEESVRQYVKGMHDVYFLPKPFALDDLVSRIHDMMSPDKILDSMA
jgi:two-component system cell cycle sensor histidine kinase/response regulator CckA